MHRQTRSKPFVSGGILSNFTGTKQNPNPNINTLNNIEVPVIDTTQLKPEKVAATSNNSHSAFVEPMQTLTVPQPVPQPVPPPLMKVESMDTGEMVFPMKRKWVKQPVNKRLKRMRLNLRLRKMLIPRNALMALRELKGEVLNEIAVTPDPQGFKATFYINNIQYEGYGLSKAASKNDACEKALRDIMIDKMKQTPRASVKGAAMNEDDNLSDNELNVDADEIEENEVPMMHLASFALYKLFEEWQADGFEIPDFKPPAAPSQPPQPDSSAQSPVKETSPNVGNRNELPENATQMHPTSLLTIMRPGVRFVDLGSEGCSPDITHRIGVEIDGHHFVATAKNKKLARKFLAIDACSKLFNIQFSRDEN